MFTRKGVMLTVLFVLVVLASSVSAEGDQQNDFEFYISSPETMYIMPGEMVYAQFGIQPINSAIGMTVVKATFFKGQLFQNFDWSNQSSNLSLTWNSVDGYGTLNGLADIGSLHFEGSNDCDSFAWYSNSEIGLPLLWLFGVSFINVAPVGSMAKADIFVQTVFEDKSVGWQSHSTTFVSGDGIRGDVSGDGLVTQEDVNLLALYQPSWISYLGRFTETGVNYGRGAVLFGEPDNISTWLINVYVNNPDNPILEGLGIGELISETAYTNVDAVTSASKVAGKVANKTGINRDVSFISEIFGNSLNIKTLGDVVKVSALLPSGEIWQDTKWTVGDEANFTISDPSLKYRIEVVSLPNKEDMATAVKEIAPVSFALDQNYPNPFNPSTTIPFTLAEAEQIRIDIFNLSGQKVDTLVNGRMSAGIHAVSWKPANGLASGAYIVRLRAGQHSSNIRVMFTK